MKKLKAVNPPVIWLWTFVTLMLALAFAFGPKAKLNNLSEVNFATTSSSLLYFKNIRSFYYDIDETRKPLILYRLKKRNSMEEGKSLNFTIISNPLNDEAYVYIETGEEFKQSPQLSVFITKETSETLLFENIGKVNNEGHFEIAASIYQALMSGETVYGIELDDTKYGLFEDDGSRQNAEIVLEDYFKLVNKL